MLDLSNDSARLQVDPQAGGRLVSLQLFGCELLVPREPDPLLWGSYPMAPWAGRTRHGRFSWGGQTHALALTLSPHAGHGTVWNRGWERLDDDRLRIDLGDGWPFAGYAEQTFRLTDTSLTMTLSVHTQEAAFPAVIGWHPWFRRRLDRGGEARLRFRAGARYLVDEEMIPDGRLGEPGAGPWDDCFRDVAEEPSLEWPGALRLGLRSSLDHWVVYNRPVHALCVEPMSGPPNALNTGADLVEVGKPLVGEFELRWQPL